MRLLSSLSAVGLALLLVVAACGGESGTGSPGEPAAVGESGASSTGASGSDAETASGDSGLSPSTGGLDLRVTDAPPEGVTRIDVTVGGIEVHKVNEEEEEGWIAVFPIATTTSQTLTFDLVEVTGIEGVLTQLEEFEVGKYTQIRMDVVAVGVTVNGEEKEASVPGDKLKVVRPFDVVAGENTVLTLDFDAAKSVVITGSGNVHFKPTVKLLVRKEDRAKSEEKGETDDERGGQASEKKDNGQPDQGEQSGSGGQGRERAASRASQGSGRSTGSGRDQITLTVVEHPDFGAILVDGEGASLYVFTNDGPNVSNCTDGCAESWPPVVASEETDGLAGEGSNADLIGTIERPDGSEQVTYDSQPLYYFSGDRSPGDFRGQGVGGVWFVISPDGEIVN